MSIKVPRLIRLKRNPRRMKVDRDDSKIKPLRAAKNMVQIAGGLLLFGAAADMIS